MKNKKNLLSCYFIVALFFFKTEVSIAQMVGPDAYIQGTSIEIGVSGMGGFEGVSTTTSPAPAGYHGRSSTGLFGFIANPQLNSWAGSAYDGDFFTPGSPENGWGCEVDTTFAGTGGVKKSNYCTTLHEIPGAITSWSYVGGFYSVDWEGDYTSSANLHFKINYLLGASDLFYTSTISITNNTAATVPNIYYYRNLDPDNNQEIGGSFTTTNTVISQHNGCAGCTTNVIATQPLPWNSYFGFLAVDTNWVAGKGGFSNRDATDMYNGIGFTQTVGAVDTADEAIYLAYKIDSLMPGGTQTFKFCSVFSSDADSCALSSLAVSIPATTNVCVNSPVFTLPAGSPAGGTYTGTGVVSGNMFDPSLTGAGNFNIVYTAPATSCVGSAVTTVHVDICAGVGAVNYDNNVSVYPNPFSNEAIISIGKSVSLSNASIHMYDLVGKEVRLISDIQSHELMINRDNLADGMYFYKLINKGQEISTGKLIIK